MARFRAPRFRASSQRRVKSLLCLALMLGPQSIGPRGTVVSEARGECGCAPAAAVPTQTYRLDYQTVYDERQVTEQRVSYETVYDTKTYTVQKPVWETQTQERRYTVQRPVWETQPRLRR